MFSAHPAPSTFKLAVAFAVALRVSVPMPMVDPTSSGFSTTRMANCKIRKPFEHNPLAGSPTLPPRSLYSIPDLVKKRLPNVRRVPRPVTWGRTSRISRRAVPGHRYEVRTVAIAEMLVVIRVIGVVAMAIVYIWLG